MTPEQASTQAAAAIDALQDAAEAHHATLAQLQANRDVSEDYRARQRATLTSQFNDHLAATHHQVHSLLATAGDSTHTARAAQAATTDPSAADRVRDALQSMGVGEMIQVLEEMGDLDGLRHLRRSLPLHIAGIIKDPTERATHVQRLQGAIDDALAATGSPQETSTVAARRSTDALRERLELVENYARHPGPGRRLQLGYAR